MPNNPTPPERSDGDAQLREAIESALSNRGSKATVADAILPLIAAREADLLVRLAAAEREREQVVALVTAACFHFWNCDDGGGEGCGSFRPAMAWLAHSIGYTSDPATDEEIRAALAASDAADKTAGRTALASEGKEGGRADPR